MELINNNNKHMPPIRTYRDPNNPDNIMADGKRISGPSAYEQGVANGQYSAAPEREVAPSQIKRDGAGFSLDGFTGNAKLMEAAKQIMIAKQGFNKDITDREAYWQNIKSDQNAFGAERANASPVAFGGRTDINFREMSPSAQASLRSSQQSLANSNLTALNNERKYRGNVMADSLSSLGSMLKEQAAAKGKDMTSILNQIKVNDAMTKGGYKQDSSGKIYKSYDGATAKQIALAMKLAESGGDYSSEGKSNEYGAYQYDPDTWKQVSNEYANEVLQQSVAMPMTPENQDRVTEFIVQKLMDEGYDARQIALIWNTSLGGDRKPYERKGTNSFGVDYDSVAHADKVLAKLGTMGITSKTEGLTERTATQLNIANKKTGISLEKLKKMTDQAINDAEEKAENDVVKNVVDSFKPDELSEANIYNKDEATAMMTLIARGWDDTAIVNAMVQSGMTKTEATDKLAKIHTMRKPKVTGDTPDDDANKEREKLEEMKKAAEAEKNK